MTQKMDRYQILEELGRGGFATVYRARDTELKRLVALKALHPHLLADTAWVERFRREAQLIAGLNHPQIVTLYDITTQTPDRLFLVMQLVEGPGLDKLLAERGRLPWTEALEIIRATAGGLDYAHRQNILHRDLKPANILMDPVRGPLLSDFGLAKLMEEHGLSQSGSIVGTPHYIPPEIWDGEPATPQADIYALGCILYELLTGERLFGGNTPPAIMMAHFRPLVLPKEWPEGMPPIVVEVLNVALAKQPKERYATAGEMVKVLTLNLTGSSRSPTPWGSLSGLRDALSPAPQLRHNLPVQTTPFLGREAELAELASLLAEPSVRLVTILGAGGMGKTRLALEAAGRQLDHFEHGVYFVRLARLDAPESIVPAIAEAVNFSFYEGGNLEQQLQDYLREKHVLLVIDNYEHLLEGVRVVVELLRIAPGLKILATSRARLNIQEEHRFPISGIDFPEAAALEAASQSSAVRLFLASARRVQPGFALTDENIKSVAQLCRLAQGMPLGIILAAAWVELLTPAEIAAELALSLDFLATELRDLPERQRSMRAVFDYSWRLLSEPERVVFQQLAVFRGGFSREAAEVVTGASLRLLMSLVNKSLLQREPDDRFEIHELLRQYGVEKLAEDPTRQSALRDRHCAFYYGKLGQREADLKGARQQAALAEIETDLENIRLAWAWAIEQGQWEVIEPALDSLYEFYHIRSRYQEGHDDFGRAVARIQVETQISSDAGGELPEIVLTKLLARQGAFDTELGWYEAADTLLQQSLALARRLDMPREQAFCLNTLGDMGHHQGAYWEAEQQYQESLAISQAIGDALAQAASLEKWGWLKHVQGSYDQSYRLWQQSLNLYRNVEQPFGIAKLFNRVALVSWIMGKYKEAEEFWTECLAISKEVGSRLGMAEALGGLGIVAWSLGGSRLPQAKQLLQERLAIIRELGHPFELASTFSLLAQIHNELGEYQAAHKYALEALTISKRIGHPWIICWSLSVLSETAIGLKDFQAAWNYGYEALENGVHIQAHPPILIALVGLAFLLAKDTDRFKKEAVPDEKTVLITRNGRAIEMLTLVMNHPAAWHVYKDKAARLRAQLEAGLPPEVVTAARERGEARDLTGMVMELLAERDQA